MTAAVLFAVYEILCTCPVLLAACLLVSSRQAHVARCLQLSGLLAKDFRQYLWTERADGIGSVRLTKVYTRNVFTLS